MLRCRPGHAGVADMVLKDRVALVTGGGTGIGLAIALAFLREGARVTIGSRNPVHLKEGSEAARAAGHAVLTLQLDVTDPASVRSAVDAVVSRFGRIDILVNNAGASGRTPMTDPDHSRWHAIIPTHLIGGSDRRPDRSCGAGRACSLAPPVGCPRSGLGAQRGGRCREPLRSARYPGE